MSCADLKDDNGDSPLAVALKGSKVDIALYLFNHGCGSDEDKDKVVMQACQSGKLKVVKELVERHNVNPKSETLRENIYLGRVDESNCFLDACIGKSRKFYLVGPIGMCIAKVAIPEKCLQKATLTLQ